jgi:hypothetical protein
MSEINQANGTDQTAGSDANAAGSIGSAPLTAGLVGIRNAVLVQPSPKVLVLRYSRAMAVTRWNMLLMLILATYVALNYVLVGSWCELFLALYMAGLALFYWYRTIRSFVGRSTEDPIAVARFDGMSRSLTTRNWLHLNRRELPFEVAAVQLVSAMGKT